ncbi:MAG: VOC family protein [Desulfuromonadales bacterium]|nr:VOC family protein [Desulfuromonadales bacterium]
MKLGHIHLKVRDLQRSIEFYRRHLGLQVTEQVGEALAFLSAGSMHHELALREVGPQATAPRRGDVGLYHVAFEVTDRQELGRIYRGLRREGIPVHAVDHRISWALYCADPDGNGLEVYWDIRRTAHGVEHWQGIERPLDTRQFDHTG